MIQVKFYGGPAHGKTMAVESRRVEITCTAPHPFNMRRDYYQNYQLPIAPDYHIKTYIVENFQLTRGQPERRKEIQVALLEGTNLLPREEHDLQSDVKKKQWKFPEVSFLNDFDEWIAQARYRATGELTWHGLPLLHPYY